MKNKTIYRAWNGLSTLAVAIGMTALTACTDQETGGAGGREECAAFDDDPSASIPIHIVNHRTTSVFLRTQCTVSIRVVDGAGTRHSAQAAPLVTTCSSAQQGQDNSIGDCMMYSGILIEPGVSRETTWSGLFYDFVDLPATCVPSDTSPSCERAIAPEPGPMTFVVELAEDENHPVDTFEVTKSFVYGTDKSIEIDVN